MLFRVVLIFPDTQSLAGFVEYLKVPGEIDSRVDAFVGDLDEEQIKIARFKFGAYIRVMRIIDKG
jgi:hypothetical protein